MIRVIIFPKTEQKKKGEKKITRSLWFSPGNAKILGRKRT